MKDYFFKFHVSMADRWPGRTRRPVPSARLPLPGHAERCPAAQGKLQTSEVTDPTSP